jgi:GT2 family glycosyltransferase
MMQASDTDRPEISVVIASVNGPQHLDECLAALEKQTVRERVEIIVADRVGASVTQLVRERYPSVRLLSFTGDTAIPALRATGMQGARGDIIAITEDHCLAPPDWCAEMLRAHQQQRGVIGGAVENDPSLTSVLDWATYLCEYARYMSPVPAGEVGDLPGNNISYRREFLEHVSDLLAEGIYWEDSLNARLRQKGVRMYSDPAIIVRHKKGFRLSEFLSQRYHYSRSYAGIRMRDASAWKRMAYAGFCLVLPVSLWGRIVSSAWSKGRQRGMLVLSLPLLALFAAVWAWGEMVGHLLGPGESLRTVA